MSDSEPSSHSEDKSEDQGSQSFPISPGLSVIGLFLTGLVGIILAIFTGSAVSLFASAISFGLIAWIAFR